MAAPADLAADLAGFQFQPCGGAEQRALAHAGLPGETADTLPHHGPQFVQPLARFGADPEDGNLQRGVFPHKAFIHLRRKVAFVGYQHRADALPGRHHQQRVDQQIVRLRLGSQHQQHRADIGHRRTDQFTVPRQNFFHPAMLVPAGRGEQDPIPHHGRYVLLAEFSLGPEHVHFSVRLTGVVQAAHALDDHALPGALFHQTVSSYSMVTDCSR